MIDYTHPGRHAHVTCRTWDDSAHTCDMTHRCDNATIVTAPVPSTGKRWVITGGPNVRSYPVGPMGRGAHRPAPVSLVKSYV